MTSFRARTTTARAASVRSNRLIVDQIDPLHLVPGGVDTCIHDLVQYSPSGTISLVGVTRDASMLGRWHGVDFAGKRVQFFPVATLDRGRGNGKKVPESFRLALGLVRYRAHLVGWHTVQTHRVETGLVVRLLLRPIKRVQFIHNDSNGLTGSDSDSYWKRARWLYRWLERRTLPSASGVVVFNRTDGPRIAELHKDVVVAQTWYNPAVFQEFRRDVGTRGEAGRVLFVGRLESQKDPLLVLEAFHRFTKSMAGSVLTVVGSGSYETSMRRMAAQLGIESSVEFAGALSRIEVARLMSESSVLLLASHYEGSPRVVAEANAVGLPVVATPGGDPDLYLERSKNGIRTESRDASELAAAMVEAMGYDPVGCVDAAAKRSAPAAIRRLLEVGI